jgi:exosortase
MRKPQLHFHTPSRSSLFLGLKITIIIVAVLAFFHQDLSIVVNDALQSEIMSYVLAIPFIFTYLVYRKRKMLRTVVSLENQSQTKEAKYILPIVETLLVITAILLYWYGSYTFQPLEYHMLALPILVASLTLIFFNPQTLRQMAFAIAFLVFLVPPPTEILYGIGANLSVLTSEASCAIVKAFGIPSSITNEYGNPSIVITRPNGTTLPFAIDIACSGIYSLIGFAVFAVLIVYVIRGKLWKKLSLAVLGIPLLYLLNIIRITTILLMGYYFGEEIALQIFHLVGGWVLILAGTLLLLLLSEKGFKTQIFASPAGKCPQCNNRPQPSQRFCFACGKILKPVDVKLSKRDITKIIVMSLAIVLIVSIEEPVFALAQSPLIVINNTPYGQTVSIGILQQLPNYNFSFVYRDTSFEKVAGQDFSLVYRTDAPIGQRHEPMYVTLQIASARSVLHAWEYCLITYPTAIGSQPEVTQIELKDVQLSENPPIIGRYFVFQKSTTSETQAVLYWYETAAFDVNSTGQRKHVEISVIAFTDNLKDLPNIENQLVALAKEIVNYWEPVKTWSFIALLMSQNSITLLAITGVLLVATLVAYALETRKQRRAKANIYQKLSIFNKQIIDAVQRTETQTLSTLDNIAAEYRKTVAESIDRDLLLQSLSRLEKIGAIRTSISSSQDEPIQTWKT